METLDQNRIDGVTRSIEAAGDKYARAVLEGVGGLNRKAQDYLDAARVINDARIIRVHIAAQRLEVAMIMSADLMIQKIMYHRSPQIFALILAIGTIVRTIVNVVNFLRTVYQVIRIFTVVNDILYAVWPEYRKQVDALLGKISQLSSAVGWGVDGFLHLFNAVQGGVNIFGALTGKNWSVMQIEMAQRTVTVAQKLSNELHLLETDPGAYIKNIFQNEVLTTSTEMGDWWTGFVATVDEGINRAKDALEYAQGSINELQALRNNMPKLVSDNIPLSIWFSLDQADTLIHDKLLPNVARLESALSTLESITGVNEAKLKALANKLAHPGMLLQDVDDLPEFLRKDEEKRVDDVTSREFEYWADTERIEIEHDLHDFDRIDALLKAPTPEPEFMTLEIPEGKTIRGVRAEPHETWFIDGYSDQH